VKTNQCVEIDKPRSNCGIFGVFRHPEASTLAYYGLNALQHRGQEGTGIVTLDYDRAQNRFLMNVVKGFGLVSEVFRDDRILKSTLKGDTAIGHNRYSTAGSANNEYNIQPFTVNYRNGHLALSHNGNLTNFRVLRKKLQDEGTIFQTTSDSEIILHLIARSRKEKQIDQIEDALNKVEGAFSLVLMTDTSLIAARDPHGVRPLVLGIFNGSYIVASETCAFDIIGAEYIRDIKPGEILIIDDKSLEEGTIQSRWISTAVPPRPSHCIFEYVYFSRPDSIIFGENVDRVRRKLGKLLAREHPIEQDDDEVVIVISVPDSSNTATLGYATESQKLGRKVRFEIGLIRSHYAGRTFIQPKQDMREVKVRTKFNTVKGVIKGRKVIVVDDSIVRGTTSKLLIKMLREAEPKEIHFRVTSPPIHHPCHYGMDFPSKDELIAERLGGDLERIRQDLGVDSIGYLSLDKMLEAVPHENGEGYCTACFSGQYPIKIDTRTSKDLFEP
jgi:amidophosphoribosyltransferase